MYSLWSYGALTCSQNLHAYANGMYRTIRPQRVLNRDAKPRHHLAGRRSDIIVSQASTDSIRSCSFVALRSGCRRPKSDLTVHSIGASRVCDEAEKYCYFDMTANGSAVSFSRFDNVAPLKTDPLSDFILRQTKD